MITRLRKVSSTAIFVLALIAGTTSANLTLAFDSPLSPLPQYTNPANRPVFLNWPLPSQYGSNQINRYPNTPWTWNFLGLNPGYQCPPRMGYLYDANVLPYWRDNSIPEIVDRNQADPHGIGWVECYSTPEPVGGNGHEGTDILADVNTPILAVAAGRVYSIESTAVGWKVILYHCPDSQWTGTFTCSGQRWYTTYLHMKNVPSGLSSGQSISAGEKVGEISESYLHLHFELGVNSRAYANFVNPWGRDNSPWDGCMWIIQDLCPNASSGFPAAPANQNLVRNGDFGATTEQWTFGFPGEIDYQVTNGVLHFMRRAISPNYASVRQDLNYSLSINSPFEINLDLANDSNVMKQVSVVLLPMSSNQGICM